ncbi:MAG: hypothetical protein JO257_22110 [Deltaproteobacteria bacterium]|nr:hypothetical protein [Deltaproteobacteria bacterium]
MSPVFMADAPKDENEGAPIPKDAIDPDLIKLTRPRPKVGVITAAGLVFLSILFLLRLNPDRRFSGKAAPPERVAVADILGGKVAADSFVSVEAEPLVSHAVRATASKGALGLRVVPARGSGERLWLVLSGDGWSAPTLGPYTGRLRALADLPFADAIRDYAKANPRPVFAAASAVRAGFATGKVTTVGGETVDVKDGDRVAFELIEPNTVAIVATLEDKLPNAAAWTTALAGAGITPLGAPSATQEQARFEVAGTPDEVSAKLQAGKLFAANVERVTRHYETTWGELKQSSPAGLAVKGASVPDGEVDLVGLYVARGIPSDAFALLVGEQPESYWYVLPVTIALAVIALIFAWALVRAVKRDLLDARA